jgi:mercuric reductase
LGSTQNTQDNQKGGGCVSNKVDNAVERLNTILPLAEKQKKLSPELARVYRMILNSYVDLGRSLNKSEIAEHVENVDEAINTLRENDMVVFDENNEPVGAYPFTMEQRDHKVGVNGHTVHSMCALDALAVSPMFNVQTHIDSICHVSSDRISIDQLNHAVLNKDANKNVHFGINWNSAANNCCATSLCTEMIFLKDKNIADKWLSEDLESREIFTIDEAIDFASQFFRPLITGI